MADPHDHEHDHHHHHDHEHSHHHHEETIDGGMTFAQKMARLLEHWVKHNDDHSDNYRTWADRARENGLPEVADKLVSAAEQTDEITRIFKEARKEVQ
jgi:hypothetical protein